MTIWKNILCFIFGHPTRSTGRHGYLLHEHFCDRCNKFFISHIHYGNMLMPADKDSDNLLMDRIINEKTN